MQSEKNASLTKTIPGGFGGGANDIVYDSGKGEIFATMQGSDTVAVFSDSSNSWIANVSIGKGSAPVALAYDSKMNEIFVADSGYKPAPTSTSALTIAPGNSNVTVISDTSPFKVLATIPVSVYYGLFGIAYDSGQNRVYASDEGTFMSAISDSTNKVISTIKNAGALLAYDSALGEIFATGLASVSVVSDISNTIVATVPVGESPSGIVCDPGVNAVFVAATDGSLTEIVPNSTAPESSLTTTASNAPTTAAGSSSVLQSTSSTPSATTSAQAQQSTTSSSSSSSTSLSLSYLAVVGVVAAVILGTVLFSVRRRAQ